MKNIQTTQMKSRMSLSEMQAYWIVENDLYLAPVELICYCVNDTRLKIKFDKGHIFGVQFLELYEINKVLKFEHFDECYKIIICKKYESHEQEEAIRQLLL